MKQIQLASLFLALFIGLNPIMAQRKVSQQKDQKQKPNIIFFLADDQDKLDYGCYGNEMVHTPAVDCLAKEGMLFNNAFTGQAICAPSRSQLYTGNYPLKNGCFLNHIPTKENQKSVSHYLVPLGYEVILAGKSHVAPNSVFNWSRAWESENVAGKPRDHLPLDSIEAYLKNVTGPFCMFVTSEYPHPPYLKGEITSGDKLKFHPYEKGSMDSKQSISKKAGYYKNIEEDNSQLEKILKWVDKYMDDNIIFIYSADHGKSGKYTVYDRGLNVPFIVRWPAVIKGNAQTDVMIHYTDVLATFIELAGGAVPEGIDGKSFASVLKGHNKEIHDYVYGVQTNQNIQRASVFPSRMVRSKKYKYIRNFNSIEVVDKNLGDNEYVNAFIKMGAEKFKDRPFEELYDIENDPYEMINLASKPEFAEVKQELIEELYRWMTEQGDILVKEWYMPLLKPTQHHLDRESKFKKVPSELRNTLEAKDYLELHY